MPSVTGVQLSDVSVVCRVTYFHIFSFQFSLLFFHISIAKQHQHHDVLVLICNIGQRTLSKFCVGTFLVRTI